jgi:hypothetical protein
LVFSTFTHFHLVRKEVEFTLKQAVKAQRIPFNLGVSWRGGANAMPQLLYPMNDIEPIVQEAGWAPWLVWMGAENLATTRIRFPDLPACSKSLY